MDRDELLAPGGPLGPQVGAILLGRPPGLFFRVMPRAFSARYTMDGLARTPAAWANSASVASMFAMTAWRRRPPASPSMTRARPPPRGLGAIEPDRRRWRRILRTHEATRTGDLLMGAFAGVVRGDDTLA